MTDGASDGSDQERISELRDILNHHIVLYYEKDDPEISDEEYDELFTELQRLEKANPELITGDSPTQRVGAPASTSFAP
ncbi:MAG TPA: hypothetical protein P5138_09455, partial [Solirubrobacterales bacterium]|nr:hypothetical protein [Solirubrobacterales bacterium]